MCFAAIMLMAIGAALGWYLRSERGSGELHIPGKEQRSADAIRDLGQSRFTNPLLECAELPETLSIGDRKGLEDSVTNLIEQKKKEGALLNVSVYFRDLNNGPWFGINETEKFYPASLLKVPLAMYYYWKADTDPDTLSQPIEFAGPKGITVAHFPPRASISEGKQYTVEELIQLMLKESDNDASMILYQFAGQEPTAGVFKDLGVDPGDPGKEYAIDVRTYASFFRILFNATYIGRTHSERMLEMMSDSSFTRGITAGVPAGVTVSQKFGEKTIDVAKNLHQLHNCGIVYAPGNPYTLCIMTQGNDFEKLAGVIKDISAHVYAEVVREN